MKMQVAKRDLEAALQVVTNSLNTSGSDISAHIVFRVQGDGVELLTFAGRLISSAPVKCVVDAREAKAFTVEGARLIQWVGAVGDEAIDLNYDTEKKVVTAKAPKGAMEFQTLDPEGFPYWDAIWPDVTEKATCKGDRLAAAVAYAKQFVFDKETKRPELCLIECRDGLISATDQKSITLVEVPGLSESALRIHKNDAPAVIRFLGTCGDTDVTLMEHDRYFIFKRADGAVFGETRFNAKYPPLVIDRDAENPIWWKVSTKEFLAAIPFLTSGAEKKDTRLFVDRPDPDGPLRVGMKAMTGSMMAIDVSVIESGKTGDPKVESDLPPGGFCVDFKDIEKVLGGWSQEAAIFGVHIRGTNGYVRFREERDGVDYTTVCAWLKDRNAS